MSFVLDSSVTLAWCFEDEHTDATDALLERVVESGADAPLLWPLEILNGLMMAERRGRIAAGDRQRPLATLDTQLRAAAGALDIEVLGA